MQVFAPILCCMIYPVSGPAFALTASSFTTTTTTDPAFSAGAAVGGLLFFFVFTAVIGGLSLMGMFKKAGRKTWEAFIPVYNSVVLLRIAGMSGWLILLMLVPVANIVVAVLLAINLAKVFGQDAGMAVLLALFSTFVYFYLSYSSVRYFGPQASKGPLGLANHPGQQAYAPQR